MKMRLSALIAGVLAGVLTSVQGLPLYWDANDSTSGAGTAPAGVWGTDAFWSSDAAGSTTPGSWVDGSTAVFSAGSDATNSYTVALTASQNVSAAGLVFKDGTATIGAASGGTLTLTSPATIDVASGHSATISGVITGTAGLVKTNSGTLTISANNTFTNPVIIGGGTLVIPGETSATAGAANPLGAAPGAAVAGSLVISNGATLRSTKAGVGSSFVVGNRGITLGVGGGIFEITDSTAGNYLAYAGIIAGSGTLTKKGNGTYYPSGANTYTGNTTNLAGTIRIVNSANNIFGPTSATLVMAGGNFLYPFDTGNRTIGNKVLMTANTTISGTPTNNFRAVNFTNNSITTTGGTLTIRNVGGGTQTFQVRFGGGGFTFSRPIVIGQASENPAQLDLLTDTPTADQTFSGLISGPGSVRRTCNGDGTGGRTIFSAANTYTGGTFLNGGHLGVGIDSTNYPVTVGPFGTGIITVGDDANDGFFASGGAHTFGNDITFVSASKFTVSGTNALTFAGSIDLGSTAKTLFISNTALTTISGVISGSGSGPSFIKAGPGTLAVSGANTFSGDTQVSNGQLLVNSSSATSGGNVTVNAGATLGGTGSISGTITVAGSVAPGANGVGTLTVQNGIDMSAATGLTWELGALKDNTSGSAGVDFDQLSVAGGNINIGGSCALTVAFANGVSAPNTTNTFWKSNHTWTIVGMTGGANAAAGFPTIQNATYPSGYFTNTVDGSGNVLLSYVATYVQAPSPTISGTISNPHTTNTTLSWASVSGGVYQIQYKNDLTATNWITIGTVTANNTTSSFVDTNTVATNRFYRIVVP